MAIPPSSKNLLIFSLFRLIILALPCSPEVNIGICQFNHDLAFRPLETSAPANNEIDSCSPVDNKTSNSLASKFSEIFLDLLIKLLVIPDIADKTIISLWPFLYSLEIISATRLIRSIEPTEVPPNFNTFFVIVVFYKISNRLS